MLALKRGEQDRVAERNITVVVCYVDIYDPHPPYLQLQTGREESVTTISFLIVILPL